MTALGPKPAARPLPLVLILALCGTECVLAYYPAAYPLRQRSWLDAPRAAATAPSVRTILSRRHDEPSSSRLFDYSKWDNLVDEDDDVGIEEDELPGPRDMRYIGQNILRQNQNFVAIREAGGKEVTADVYARSPDSDTFWFVGKVARVSDVTVERAVARQWSLIETHAARLRPLELYPRRGELELWTAPGDSELDVAYNRPTVRFEKMSRPEDVPGVVCEVRPVMIGFQGEVYQDGEEGFRTLRTDDGLPLKPEITDDPAKGPKRAPNDAEFEEIQEMLKGKDLNDFFDK